MAWRLIYVAGLELERAAMEENVTSGTWRAGMSSGVGKS